jgi:hypothetical protein
VNTYHAVLYLHFLSLLVGVSAGAIEVICLFRLRAAETLADALPWGQLAGQIEKAFPVAILGLFGSGAYMTSDLWTWSTTWIVLPIVGLGILSLQGPLVAGQRGHAVKAALKANGPGPLGPQARRLTRDPLLWAAAFANEGLVLGIIWVMTQKPGYGEGIAALAIAYAAGVVVSLAFTRAPGAEAAPATDTA